MSTLAAPPKRLYQARLRRALPLVPDGNTKHFEFDLVAQSGTDQFNFLPGHFISMHLPDRAVWLLFGVRYPETILYRSEFEQLAAAHPNFHFWPTLSRAPDSWAGRRGHVQPHVEEHCRDRVAKLDIYVCGLKAMVDDMRARLKALGFDRKAIHYEKYD